MKLDYDLARRLVVKKYMQARNELSAGITFDEAYRVCDSVLAEFVALNDLLDAAVTGPDYLLEPLKAKIATAADSIMKRTARRQSDARAA